MGFNKRYITKDSLISHISSGKRAIDLLKADALIMDEWSSYFFNNYDTSTYQDIRTILNSQTQFSSTHTSIYNHPNFNSLKKLSNILENLIIDASWVDIVLTTDILDCSDCSDEHRGKFTKLKEYCIDKIISHYTAESRENKLNGVLG